MKGKMNRISLHKKKGNRQSNESIRNEKQISLYMERDAVAIDPAVFRVFV